MAFSSLEIFESHARDIRHDWRAPLHIMESRFKEDDSTERLVRSKYRPGWLPKEELLPEDDEALRAWLTQEEARLTDLWRRRAAEEARLEALRPRPKPKRVRKRERKSSRVGFRGRPIINARSFVGQSRSAAYYQAHRHDPEFIARKNERQRIWAKSQAARAHWQSEKAKRQRREADLRWRQSEKFKAYQEANRAKAAAATKAWRLANPEKVKEMRRKWTEKRRQRAEEQK